MEFMHNILKNIILKADKIAGFCFFAVMALVVLNIITRKVFNYPIMGTYELVGLLTATGIALALANCTQSNGHVAMGLLVDRLSKARQLLIDIIVYSISLGLWLVIAWQLFIFGGTTFSRGLVSSTALIPIYPFIFAIALGVSFLCLVLAFKLAYCYKTAFTRTAEKGETR